MAITSSDAEEILCSNLGSNIVLDDENCTLISATSIEQAGDFEVWLQKNGVDAFVSNDSIQDCVSSLEVDPFLSQICDTTSLDGDLQCGIRVCESPPVPKPKPTKVETKRPTILRSPKPKKSSRSRIDKNMNSVVSTFKYKQDVLAEKCASIIEADIDEDACSIIVRDLEGQMLFAPQILQLTVTTPRPQREESVNTVNFLTAAKNLHIMLPQLITSCGLKIILCPLEECNAAFTHIANARLHALRHTGIKPFKCDIPDCPWEFYTQFKLSRHKTTHSKSKNFICDFKDCNRSFTTIYNLNGHKKNHEKPAILECPVKDCTQAFQTEKERRIHCKTHKSEEAPYRCNMLNCTKSFFTPTSLQTHAKCHSHKESDICCQYPDCGRVFDTPYRLKEHLRSHTGQRPYACRYEECTWRFTTASKLRRHQSSHTKDRKFHCTIGTCTKSFLRPEHLKDHTLTHIGQKPCECEVCGATFIGKSSLYVHIKKTHPEQRKKEKKVPPKQPEKQPPSSDVLLEQAIQSLGVPSDMMLGTALLPEELLENENFSTVNLRDLD